MGENKAFIGKGREYKKLLVEGNDDANVCYHLLTSHRIAVKERDTKKVNSDIEIVAKNGVENLLASLHVELRDSRLASLGILVDADEDIAGRWQSIRTTIIDKGYSTVPAYPELGGTIIHESDQPTIGIWIMPNNELPGMLEHFCRFLVPHDDCLWDHAERIVEQIIQTDCRFPQPHIMKAQIHILGEVTT